MRGERLARRSSSASLAACARSHVVRTGMHRMITVPANARLLPLVSLILSAGHRPNHIWEMFSRLLLRYWIYPGVQVAGITCPKITTALKLNSRKECSWGKQTTRRVPLLPRRTSLAVSSLMLWPLKGQCGHREAFLRSTHPRTKCCEAARSS
ncbi:hypothetical protein BC628DRAFT_1093225 [Trametes gibbosa]|nr:hypothetical protein BC628DRAFT_1093225 [Trametes gibbosa]